MPLWNRTGRGVDRGVWRRRALVSPPGADVAESVALRSRAWPRARRPVPAVRRAAVLGDAKRVLDRLETL